MLDLATGERTVLAGETHNVDDQIEWLDDDTILYGLPRDDEPGVTDVWSLDTTRRREAAALHRAGVVPHGRALTNAGYDANGIVLAAHHATFSPPARWRPATKAVRRSTAAYGSTTTLSSSMVTAHTVKLTG